MSGFVANELSAFVRRGDPFLSCAAALAEFLRRPVLTACSIGWPCASYMASRRGP